MSGVLYSLKVMEEKMKTFIISCLISIALLTFYSFSAYSAESAEVIFRVSSLYLFLPLSILISVILICIEHFVHEAFHTETEKILYKPGFSI